MKNILWLHDMGDPKQYRIAIKELEFMLELYQDQANVYVHNAAIKLPKKFRDGCFWDGIFLGPTFLGNRLAQNRLEKIKKKYAWIKNSTATKIALPQDDYDCNLILDDWLVDWNINVCITPITKHWKILYPKFSSIGVLEKGYTAYISEEWIEKFSKNRESSLREIDISYRASQLPANFGSLGKLKSEIAEIFLSRKELQISNLNTNISCNASDVIYGEKWHDFLENSKFTLATPSGSSLIDPVGKIRACVDSKEDIKSFEDIEKECFPGQDGIFIFDCIGPRHIEAALAETVMIGTFGEYSGLLEPDVHYIQIEKDCSNINEVIQKLVDPVLVERIRKTAKEKILSTKDLRLSNIAERCYVKIKDSSLSKKNTNLTRSKISFKIISIYINFKNYFFWFFFRKVRFIFRFFLKG